MRVLAEAVADPTIWTLIVTVAALIVVGGGVFAHFQSFRRPSYDQAIAYGVGGLFATLFLVAVGYIAYLSQMASAQGEIIEAPVSMRTALLLGAELEARSSLFIAFIGAGIAVAMSFVLFVRALLLRRTGAPEQSAEAESHERFSVEMYRQRGALRASAREAVREVEREERPDQVSGGPEPSAHPRTT